MVTTTNMSMEYVGLSTDTPKPTSGVPNGSVFIEMDTSKVYMFNAASGEWVEIGGSGS